MDGKLKPCPLCESKVEVVEDAIGAYVWCSTCKCGIARDRYNWTICEAIYNWNRRSMIMILYSNEKILRKNKLQEKISGVVSRDIEEATLKDYSPMEVQEAMKELYFVENYEGMETNGWQVDFWITYIIDEEKFMYSGSWYSGEATFRRVDE